MKVQRVKTQLQRGKQSAYIKHQRLTLAGVLASVS